MTVLGEQYSVANNKQPRHCFTMWFTRRFFLLGLKLVIIEKN